VARLPSERYLIQQVGREVLLFEEGSEREVVRFDPADRESVMVAQLAIRESDLTGSDKAFAHFWSGYFYAYACGDGGG
jgi:predicted transcriptional regulator